jgi:sec-independent protein translocase protein TatA
MFGIGLPEALVIGGIVVVIFGAKRLPDIGSGLGRTIRELKKLKQEREPDKKAGEKEPEGLVSGLKKEVESIPGLKEAKEIKETVDKVKGLTNVSRWIK